MAATTDTQTEADSAAEEGKAPAKRKFSLKLILMAVGGLVALGGVGWGGYYFFFSESPKSEAATAANQIKPPVFMDMPEVLVNLSNTGGNEHTQYLKVKVVLELPNQELTAQIQPVMPRLMDTFQTYLRECLYRLKEELTRRVNAAIAPSRINAVLFKEIVIQ
jgi:flagellar FliL protein